MRGELSLELYSVWKLDAWHDVRNRTRATTSILDSVKKDNGEGYERELPGRTVHDYCAIDTESPLSYLEKHASIVSQSLALSVRTAFGGPGNSPRNFEIGCPHFRGG